MRTVSAATTGGSPDWRQPANFSLIDYRLHNPAFAWHLIISLRDPAHPVLQPFRVHKDLTDLGISDQDACQGSELAYPGPEVAPLALLAHGAPRAVRHLASTLGLGPAAGPNAAQAPAGRRRRPGDLPVSWPPAAPAKPAGRPAVQPPAAKGDCEPARNTPTWHRGNGTRSAQV